MIIKFNLRHREYVIYRQYPLTFPFYCCLIQLCLFCIVLAIEKNHPILVLQDPLVFLNG